MAAGQVWCLASLCLTLPQPINSIYDVAMKVGFTGTRVGMTRSQMISFSQVMGQLWPAEFHHGACVGADEDAAVIASSLIPIRIIAHPGVSEGSRIPERPHRSTKSIEVSNEVRGETSHFERNRNIVCATDLLIACPPSKPLPSSGGTAYTVGYARSAGNRTIVIWPEGEIEDSEAE